MENFIYNKSSENMTECRAGSVDLVIAGPPYNIGTKYGENKDCLPFVGYKKMLTQVIKECHRVLKADGTKLIEAADSVLMDGKYVQLASLIQSFCLQNGFFLSRRHLNFARTRGGVELPEDDRWSADRVAKKDAHSNIHQWLVFRKKETTFSNGNIFYINYQETPEHPCPFPDQATDLFLDWYFKPGMTVLDPFMGTGALGRKVIARQGSFIGYEIDPKIFQVAQKNLGLQK